MARRFRPFLVNPFEVPLADPVPDPRRRFFLEETPEGSPPTSARSGSTISLMSSQPGSTSLMADPDTVRELSPLQSPYAVWVRVRVARSDFLQLLINSGCPYMFECHDVEQ